VQALTAQLLSDAALDEQASAAVQQRAAALVRAQRAALEHRWIDRFLQQYGLDSAEGLALLTLAEAYLRVPDASTASKLIAEKITDGNWRSHRGASQAWRVNALTRLLIVARAAIAAAPGLSRLARPWVALSMQMLGRQFVFGRDIQGALARAARRGLRDFVFSYDMLGESARTDADAARYLGAYRAAIEAVGARAQRGVPSGLNDGISVKLSALNCRYEPLQRAHAVPELIASVTQLALVARAGNIGLTIDAEESERLEMSLAVIAAVARDARLQGWDGFGLAVQAYQRRAVELIDWAQGLARHAELPLNVRLVKGAYWDQEIERAQERSLEEFPVYTRKSATDVSYLACARRLLCAPELIPAFATHNARTAATILHWARGRGLIEFQRLHGMGVGLYEGLMREGAVRCRIYAPVGGYAELLPYLVRRILENGANAGFVHQLGNAAVGDERLLIDPVRQLQCASSQENESIVAPMRLFADRANSAGIDFSDAAATDALLARMALHWQRPQHAAPLIDGREAAGVESSVRDPADTGRIVGTVAVAGLAQLAQAFEAAQREQPRWAALEADTRAQCLERAADLIERERDLFMALAVREAGKSIADALAEVREAVDFCRYYAVQARRLLQPQPLPGPTGERNEWRWAARGTFACISPWNFPLAIFMGQIAAALVTGNAVLAKPAPQTPLIAHRAVRALLEAGVPPGVIACLPGDDALGAALVGDRRLAGVAFTGSNATARRIAQALLADETRALLPLIAETGGLNAMIVDSTALLERAVGDALASAFQSAGQRCSALRLLCVQEDIAPALLAMLCGAMAKLRIGDPGAADTDVGPVIDAEARRQLEDYIGSVPPQQVLYRCPLPPQAGAGHFVAPTLVRLAQIEDLRRELFGPVLHVVSWRAGELERTVDRINASGYGLTMGLQTRLTAHIEQVRARARVGNLYVNRSMIGAVVGSQPFGGEGLSGTGPKAGGPNYLARFMTERALSVDTTAAGGNVQLLRESE
jgi:RHH-type transcriptional regulator, proline utilization regulon repressor / proline dehydrogenase / delta 1-pyrroline-5-carboxylate dehydrogenase